MNILLRRIIFIVFAVAYLATTTAVLLYASGYTFGVLGGIFTKTGILFVKTEPKEVTILINNVVRGNKTPRRIGHLKPGLYRIRIEHADYHPWEKTLEIKAGDTTFITDVILWKKTLPSLVDVSDTPPELLDGDIPGQIITFSPDKQRRLFITPGPEQSLHAVISPFSDSEKQIALVDYFPPTTTKKILWHDRAGWLLFIEDAEKHIWRFNILDRSLKYLTNGTLINVAEPHLYILKPRVQEGKRTVALVAFNMTTERERIITEFEEQETPEYVASKNYLSLLQNIRAQTMTLFNTYEETASPLPFQPALSLATSPDPRVYAYFTPHELSINAYDKKNVLLWRTSETIRDVSFIGKEHYMVVRTNEKTRIVELDVRDGLNIVDLPFPPATGKLLINDNGDELFVYAVLGTQRDLFRLELR